MSSEKISKKFKAFENFFNLEQLEVFLETSTYKKATLISPFIRERCFINSKEKCIYILQENNTYKTSNDIDNTLITIISAFINDSVDTYIEKNADKSSHFIKKYLKAIQYNQSNASINQYKPQLITFLTENDNKMNYTPGQIHFSNGYIESKTGEFFKRTHNFLITKYIERDYVPSTKEERTKVMTAYNQIYPNDKDRDIVLGNIAIALSWEATKNQTSLFLTGTGSSGKSFLMETLARALGPYFVELKGDTFSNDTKMDKVLNTMGSNIQALIVWMNELASQKMNTSVFKDFCDGTANTTKLYEDGSHNIKHNAYVVSTGNELPNMIQDSGTKRRIVGYTHTSEFTSDGDKVDAKKHIYKIDKDLKNNLAENAIFDIFVSYCKKWAKDEKVFDVIKSENFQTTSDIMTSSNDFFQDFIDSRLVITNNPKDRIGKEKMREMYLQMYPDKHITVLQIISSLRDKKITYVKGDRVDGVRGCFICVKAKADIMDEEDDDKPAVDNQSISDMKKQLQEMKKKYDQLKKLLNMKRQMEAIDNCAGEYKSEAEEENETAETPAVVVENDVIISNNDDEEVQRCEADEDDLLNDDLTICFGI